MNHINFLIFVYFSFCGAQTVEEINYYENLIEENEREAKEYVFHKSAKEYYCDLKNFEEFGSYDFIVVGAGATGTVIANRLSEVDNFTVLLLDAGNFKNDFVEIPSMRDAVANSDYNWQYVSVPQKTACLGMVNFGCTYPRGKGIGGTTLINSLVYSRGNPKDFDRWEKLGNPGWAFKDILPYFKKSESYHQNNPNATVYWPYHGQNGELYTEYALPETFIGKKFTQACRELGYNSTDINGPRPVGYTFPPFNTKNGKRWDGGSAFVTPVLCRRNLKVLTSSYVTKINIKSNSKTAEGVSFCHNGTAFFVKATKEVILSAGAIESPHLLLLSGIGPKKHLRKHGIDVVKDLEVGRSLHDHTKYYGLVFSMNYTEEPKPEKEYITEYLHGIGPYTAASTVGGILFAQTNMENTPNYPDVELLVVPPNSSSILGKKLAGWTEESWSILWEGKDVTKHFVIMASHLHTVSSGSVQLKSRDPFEYPLINSMFLSDPKGKDIESLYQAIQLALDLVQSTKSFQEIDAQLTVKYLPACSKYKYPSRKWWYCAIRHLSSNNYHPFGSCVMGPNPSKGAVVNFELKVHGVKRLRVADASIFPKILTGHPNPPCVMVGEKVSDMIKKEYHVT